MDEDGAPSQPPSDCGEGDTSVPRVRSGQHLADHVVVLGVTHRTAGETPPPPHGSGDELMSDASVVDNASPLGIRGGADDGDPSEVGGQQQASSRLPPHVQLNNAGSTATVRTAAGDSQLEEKLKDLIRR